MNPVKVFGALAALLAAIAALVLVTRAPAPEATQLETPPTTPADLSLTDEEAIARFKELNEKLRSASQERSFTQALAILTNDSPLRRVVRAEVQQLIDDQVLDRSKLETLAVEVVSNKPGNIALQERVRVQPRFVAENSDREVTQSETTLETVNWILRLANSEWLIHDAVVVRQRDAR